MADLGELVLRLRVDDAEYSRDLERARRRALLLDDINVGLTPSKSFRETEGRLNALQRERIRLTAQIDTGAQFARLDAEIAKLQSRQIRLNVNTQNVDAQLQKLNNDVARLNTERIRLQADPTASVDAVEKISDRIRLLEARRLKLDLNRQEVFGEIGQIETRLNAIQDERVNVDINAQGATARIAEIDRELGKLPASTATAGKSFSALQGVIAGASAAIVTSLISIGARLASIPGQIAAISLGNFRDFDAELQQFSALTGKARDEIGPLTDEIKRLGIETTKAPTEIARAANALITLGASADDVQDQLAGVVALSESTGVGLEQAAELIQLAANTFGSSSDEIADKLSVLRNTTAASVGDVQQLIQQASGIFNSLGESADPDELLALFATLRDGGLNAEVAATGLRGVIATLVDPAKAKDLEALGVSAFNAQGQFVGFEAILRQLQVTQQQLASDPSQFTGALVGAFGREGVSTITTGLDLLDSKFTTTFANIQAAQGTAAATSGVLTQGFAGSLNILQGSLEALSIAFGEALAPLVQFGAELATQLANTLLTTPNLFLPISDAIERFKAAITGNPELISSLTQSLVDLVAVGVSGLGDALVGVAQFFEDPANIQAVVQGFQDFVATVAALGALIGPLAAVVSQSSALSVGVRDLIDGIPLLGNAIRNPLDPLAQLRSLFALLNPLLNGTQAALSAVRPIVDAIANPFRTLGAVIDGVRNSINLLLGRLGLLRAEGINPSALGGSLGGLPNPLNFIPRKHGGPVLPGQTYLAGEAGPELLRMGGRDALITQPSLMRFDQPGRIFSAPQTRRRLSKGDEYGLSGAKLDKVYRVLKSMAGEPRGDIQTTVEIQGMSPDDMRKQLSLHQLDLYRSLGGL